jgi:N-acetylglucosaminyl-diphospho-decaprenol L-rhamnosyltransferase
MPLLEAEAVDVSILIVNYNSPELLPRLFSSLQAATKQVSHEIIFVDNASLVDCKDIVMSFAPQARFIQNSENVGFGRANNQALSVAKGKFVLLLNTDAFVSADTLLKTYAYMLAHPLCGILGVRLVGRDGTLQPSCRYFPTPLNIFLFRTGLQRWVPWSIPVDDMNWNHADVRECDWVPGCYYLVRREVINQVGLFDPRYFLYCEEVDHCRTAKNKGWKVIYFPDTTVIHLGGESAKTLGTLSQAGQQISALQLESELLYFRKHYTFLGVILHLLLVTLASVWSVFADVLKRRKLSGIKPASKNVTGIWKLFIMTKFAKVATR